MVRKPLTHEEFMIKFYEKNKNAKNIEILGIYVNSRTKIKCKCKIDNHIWYATPHSLLSGTGCSKCSNVYKRTHEEFIQEIKEINDNIEILGEYIDTQTKIKCRCRIDDYEWEGIPRNLLRGQGCPKCGGTEKLTHEEFIEKFKKQNKNAKNIDILGEYKGSNIKIKCRCKIDEKIWYAKPSSLLKGTGCPKCKSEKLSITHEEFISRIKKINNDIEILGEYKDSRTKIKCRCKKDGYIWSVIPSNLLKGTGCPKCNTTKGEKRIAEYLDSKNIEYIYNKGYFKDLIGIRNKVLRPDFIIENMKIWIEFDGIGHFEPTDFAGKGEEWAKENFRINQENDKLKNEYAKENNWKMIRIPYTDFDRIEEILDRELFKKE